MATWIETLAETLGEDPLSARETAEILGVAREVAHRVERRLTPLATFLAGVAAGRGMAGGTSRGDALSAALETIGSLLPEAGPERPPP